MAWYDYVPAIGPAVAAAKGDWGKAALEFALPVAGGAIEGYKGAVDEQKQGLQNASQASASLADKLYGESMTGLKQAQAEFAPARAAALYGYGDPAAMTGGPSMYPTTPARPR